jgi:DNA-binding CsgD family transcriptional regulator
MSPSSSISNLTDTLRMTTAGFMELSERIEALYASRSLGSLIVAAIDLLTPCFSADSYSAGFTDPARRRHIAISRPTGLGSSSNADQYRQLAHQSPMLQYWLRTSDHNRVLRRSDCCNLSDYSKTDLFNQVDRPCNVIQHLGTWLRPGNGHHIEIAMSRGGKTDFSTADVERLSLLRKHIFRAYRNVCDFQRLESAGGIHRDDLPPDAVELQSTSLTVHVDRPLLSPRAAELTPREREILHWIVEGKTNREIGIILSISWRTVRLHCERIFRKLNVETRTAAAVRVMELGLKL